MNTAATHAPEKYADKIAKLLRKAEATTPEEAELLFAKAQSLMTQYAIDEELIRRARGDNEKTQEKVVERQITYTGIYHPALYDIGAAIAKANDCRVLISKLTAHAAYVNQYGDRVPARKVSTRLHVIGFESDVSNVFLLDASVQIQAAAGLKKWWTENKADFANHGGMSQFKARREFIFGFARGLSHKLQTAKKEGQEEARVAEANRVRRDEGVSTDVACETATESVALVVADKRQRVTDWVDEQYGNSLRSVSRNYSSGSASAFGAGHHAGANANVSNSAGIGGGSHQLGSGAGS